MNKKEKMYQRITEHGENLKRLFKMPETTDPVKLCKQLRRLELKANQIALDYCNGSNGVDADRWEELTDVILKKVRLILKGKNKLANACILVNGDARGYALKINDEYIRMNQITIYRDWGGYGIIAPDLRESN